MISDFNISDTICAVSTPAGVGGIAVVRVSGPEAVSVASAVWKGAPLDRVGSHTVHLGCVLDEDGAVLDQCVATVFRGPASFTGQDVVEFGVHGSAYVQQALLTSLISHGARLASAGEFTRRAFANGKLDLAQAEAVADVIASESREAHRLAISQMRGQYSGRLKALRERLVELASLLELELDFSEEDVEFASRAQLLEIANDVRTEVERLASSFKAGSAIKQGIPVAIIGPTNAGKSSLLNALLGDDRAIVSDIHGTTRDVVEDRLSIDGFAFRIMDTAGIRHTSDTIEALGIERSRKAAEKAAIIIAMIDASLPAPIEMPDTDAEIIVAINKSDLAVIDDASAFIGARKVKACINISAATGAGLDALKSQMSSIAKESMSAHSSVLVTNARHYEALQHASESVSRAIEAIHADLSGDLIAQDIRLTIHHLSSILGQITTPEILSTIFSRFCIGK